MTIPSAQDSWENESSPSLATPIFLPPSWLSTCRFFLRILHRNASGQKALRTVHWVGCFGAAADRHPSRSSGSYHLCGPIFCLNLGRIGPEKIPLGSQHSGCPGHGWILVQHTNHRNQDRRTLTPTIRMGKYAENSPGSSFVRYRCGKLQCLLSSLPGEIRRDRSGIEKS